MTRTCAVWAVALGLFLTTGAMQVRAQAGAAPQKKEAQAAAKVTDPVCGMQIEPAKAAAKSQYKGQTYYFCSDHCKRKFDAAPESFVKKESK